MLNELKEIQNAPRAVALVFEANIHILVDELLKEYRMMRETKNWNLGLKATKLKLVNVIDRKLEQDIQRIYRIRNRFAHLPLIKTIEFNCTYKNEVNNFTIIKEIKKSNYEKYKKLTSDQKFWKGCHSVLNQLGEKYQLKIHR